MYSSNLSYNHSVDSQEPQSFYSRILLPDDVPARNHSPSSRSHNYFFSHRSIADGSSRQSSLSSRSSGTTKKPSFLREPHMPTILSFQPQPSYNSPALKRRSRRDKIPDSRLIKARPRTVGPPDLTIDKAVRIIESRKRPSILNTYEYESQDSFFDGQDSKRRCLSGRTSQKPNVASLGDKSSNGFKYTSLTELKNCPFKFSPNTSLQISSSLPPCSFSCADSMEGVQPRTTGASDPSTLGLSTGNISKRTVVHNRYGSSLRRRIPYMSPSEIDALLPKKTEEPTKESNNEDVELPNTDVCGSPQTPDSQKMPNAVGEQFDDVSQFATDSSVEVLEEPSAVALNATKRPASLNPVGSVARFIANLEAQSFNLSSPSPNNGINPAVSGFVKPVAPSLLGKCSSPAAVHSRVNRIRGLLSALPSMSEASGTAKLAVVSNSTVASALNKCSLPSDSHGMKFGLSGVAAVPSAPPVSGTASTVVLPFKPLPVIMTSTAEVSLPKLPAFATSPLAVSCTSSSGVSSGVVSLTSNSSVASSIAPLKLPSVTSVLPFSSPTTPRSEPQVTSTSFMPKTTITSVAVVTPQIDVTSQPNNSAPVLASSPLPSIFGAANFQKTGVVAATLSETALLSFGTSTSSSSLLPANSNTNTISKIPSFPSLNACSKAPNFPTFTFAASNSGPTTTTIMATASVPSTSGGSTNFLKLGVPAVSTSSGTSVFTFPSTEKGFKLSAPSVQPSTTSNNLFGSVPPFKPNPTVALSQPLGVKPANSNPALPSSSTPVFSFLSPTVTQANPTFCFSASPSNPTFLTSSQNPTTTSSFSFGAVASVQSSCAPSWTNTGPSFAFKFTTTAEQSKTTGASFTTSTAPNLFNLGIKSTSLPSVTPTTTASPNANVFIKSPSVQWPAVSQALNSVATNPFSFTPTSIASGLPKSITSPVQLFQFESTGGPQMAVSTSAQLPSVGSASSLFSFGQQPQAQQQQQQPQQNPSSQPFQTDVFNASTSATAASNIFQFGSSKLSSSTGGFNFGQSPAAPVSQPTFGSQSSPSGGFVFGQASALGGQSPNPFTFGTSAPNPAAAGAIALPRRRPTSSRRTRLSRGGAK
ncbi:unnamed protein product [Calicophoron daubneyi]|uniref:Uncharacterized protein n=1 Tax=Calicophoron daubneyi TaxID=300641 RepID=A0AAV2TBN2_CALDB